MKKTVIVYKAILLLLFTLISFICFDLKKYNIESKSTELARAGDIAIGQQVWMTENLNVSVFRNGDPIPQAKTVEDWKNAISKGKPAWCYYDNNAANGIKYGKLYNWYAVHDSRGLAPKGYHIPTDAEWTLLTDYLGGEIEAGPKMKSSRGWYGNGNGTNSSGFIGLPGGYRDHFGLFDDIEMCGFWWSFTRSLNNLYYTRVLCYGDGIMNRVQVHTGVGLSVRCLKDAPVQKNIDIPRNTAIPVKEVTIGRQVWMTENLNVVKFRNGDPIPEAKSDNEWQRANSMEVPAWCYFDDNAASGIKYGKLYNWYAVNDPRGLAPQGYHIPTDAEWTILKDNLGGTDEAGAKMKSSRGWYGNGNGTNSSGFTGLPGGSRGKTGGYSQKEEGVGFWWSTTYDDAYPDYVWMRFLTYKNGILFRGSLDRGMGLSVRCIRDTPIQKKNVNPSKEVSAFYKEVSILIKYG